MHDVLIQARSMQKVMLLTTPHITEWAIVIVCVYSEVKLQSYCLSTVSATHNKDYSKFNLHNSA